MIVFTCRDETNQGRGAGAKMVMQQERRQFGRRQTALHAWIKIAGRPPVACVVRNLSVNGALLEFDVPEWMPFEFQLVIEAGRFEVDCELRHKGNSGCGVMFVERKSADEAVPKRVEIEASTWNRSIEPFSGRRY